MKTENLIYKALHSEFLSVEEGKILFETLPLADLMMIGNELRKKLHPEGAVTWIIDRNVNITNVCISGCKFCNFYRTGHSTDAYITTIPESVSYTHLTLPTIYSV